MADKGPDAFRTISEAAAEIGEAAHVLRFWETQFSFVRPMRRSGGRRLYRPADVLVLRSLRKLLHEDGLSIAHVQRLPRRAMMELAAVGGAVTQPVNVDTVGSGRRRAVLAAAIAAKSRLDALLAG